MPNPRPRAPLATPERPGRDLSKPLPAALSWITLIAFSASLTGAYFALGLAWWVPALYGAASVVAFAAYGIDKVAARRQANRISEQTLLVLGLVGGWPGALVAQQVFRHKTRKRSFRRAFWGTVGVNILALAAYVSLTAPVLGT
ncbi:DUF1294 domain-containing protein [Microbacterium trichothecenolyticum]|uniref:DUF1294 domain-containing protein n=1 Tax=Microbacterium ureisolvens TaxID=2781186 RepID=A0ABS7HWH4_9MICO|nr:MULTISPECIES: DUF1294 domain-containing protein [Microbacterium]MBW9108902.1 DUF1294 domain-containing protein [Microbacterium ureisolvens]MBW9120583.1 DUF1294 domain-containing protein [Microbacterium trichothecenolyticum]